MIQLECGKVNTKGVNHLQRPPKEESSNNEQAMPFGPNFGQNVRNFGFGMSMPMIPQFTPQPSQAPKPKWTVKIPQEKAPVPRSMEPSLKVSLPAQNFGQQAVYAEPARPIEKPSVKKQPNRNANNINNGHGKGGAGKRPKKSGAGKVIAEGGDSGVEEKPVAENNHSGMCQLFQSHVLNPFSLSLFLFFK